MKIDKKTPPPEQIMSGRQVYPWQHMNINDSIFVKCLKKDSAKMVVNLCTSSRNYCKKHKLKFKFHVRQVDGGVRAWRVE